MRDPAVLAVFVLCVTAAEFAALASGAPIVRLYWPPVPCRGSEADGTFMAMTFSQSKDFKTRKGAERWLLKMCTR